MPDDERKRYENQARRAANRVQRRLEGADLAGVIDALAFDAAVGNTAKAQADADEIEEAGADASIPEDEVSPEDEAKPTRKTRGKSKSE